MPYRATLCLLLLGLLAGCSTPGRQAPESTPDEELSQEAVEQRVRETVARARESQSPERERHLLSAGELLVAQEEFDWARNLLGSVDARQLTGEDFFRYTELMGAVALNEGAYILARRILTNPRLERQWDSLPDERARALRRYRAQLFERTGEPVAAAGERIALEQRLDEPDAVQTNREQLWQGLMTLSPQRLERAIDQAGSDTLAGWLTLAALTRNTQTDLERQQERVRQWQADWPDHPASQQPPDDLQLLRRLIEQQPRQIALLLPSEGPLSRAADAIRDGFMVGYYRALDDGSKLPRLRSYDTAGAEAITDLYERAVAEGADLVIGPLDKQRVDGLYEANELPIPVLTLNYRQRHEDSDRSAPEGLYQFGLAAEDEARQVARRAHRDGHRRAMVMAPDRGWSRRGVDAFAEQWRSLDGKVVVSDLFSASASYSQRVQQALLIDRSQARRQKLTRLLGSQMEFEPRRRKDLDMIFVMAEPEQARQLRPTLAFHYAGDLPVYATSHLYTGEQDPESNRDLNGVMFNTLPWLLSDGFPEKQALAEHSGASAIYSRLHALGLDAFRLYPRLPQLYRIEQARLYGATGTLRLRPDGRIEREQVWARFEDGEARPLLAGERLELDEQKRDDLQPPDAR